MTTLRAFLALSLLLFATSSPHAASSAAAKSRAPTVEIVRAEFGLFNSIESEKLGFQPSTVVPYVMDQGYGWVIAVRTTQDSVRIREEFTLPMAPTTWGDPDPRAKRTISADGRTALTEQTLEVKDGVIFQGWSVAPGDPKGSYVIQVHVENEPVETFKFEVK